MDQQPLSQLLRPALGKVPVPAARGVLLQDSDEVFLNYDWIMNWAVVEQVMAMEDVAMDDGEHGLVLRRVK